MTTSWDAQLRAHGYRITPQRQLVLQAVEELQHATPEEILAHVQTTAAGVNLSTVYRALEVLEEVDLVTHAHLDHRAPTYHAKSLHQHIHLVCTRCSQVEGIDAQIAARLIGELAVQHGFSVDISHMTLHGTCRACSAGA
jgi:Fur family ferric uptake transcriptional regulator